MSESQREAAPREPPAGIGGWLVLPVMHLALDAGMVLFAIGPKLALALLANRPVGTSDDPMLAVAPLTRGDEAAFALFCAAIVAFAVYCLVRVLKRRKNAPRLMAVFFLLMLAVSGARREVLLRSGAPATSPEALAALLSATIGFAIWIPYLLVSVRVKNTFVR